MKEERKHEIEDIIDNALTEEDCKAWAEGNLTDHVKQLIKEYHIKQLNIWDDVCEIVEVEEKTYKYKAYFENKDCPVAVGTIEADSKSDAEKMLFGICSSWTDENGNVFEAGCPVNVEVEEIQYTLRVLAGNCGDNPGHYKAWLEKNLPQNITLDWVEATSGVGGGLFDKCGNKTKDYPQNYWWETFCNF